MYLRYWVSIKSRSGRHFVIRKISSLVYTREKLVSLPGSVGLLRKPPFTILLKNPCQHDSSFLISISEGLQDCVAYVNLGLTHASRNFFRIERWISLSRRTFSSSWNFAVALAILRSVELLLLLKIVCPR